MRAPGVCGELAQGIMGDAYFLVTCPVDYFSRVQVRLFSGGPGVEAPVDCAKTAAAVAATLAHLGRGDLKAAVTVSNPIPKGKGLGSSSADLAAAIGATALALGIELDPAVIAGIALSVEPTDGVMLSGIALFDHRNGQILESLGPPPPMEIVGLDLGGTVDTVEFNRVDRSSLWRSVEAESVRAMEMVRTGVENSDPVLVGRGATVGAKASQKILPKARFDDVLNFANEVGAVGVNVAHSGTVLGVLLDARERRGKSTFRRALEAFPEAENIYHFRLIGGGIQVAEAPAGV